MAADLLANAGGRLTHFSLLMIGSLLTLLPVALSRAIAINVTGAPCCYRVRRYGGGVVAVAALALARQRVVESLLLTLTGGLTLAPICLVFWTISPITPGCRSGRR